MCEKIGHFCINLWDLIERMNWVEMTESGKEEIPMLIEDIIKVHMKCVKN